MPTANISSQFTPLLHYYLQKLPLITKALGLPPVIQTTTALLLTRFYYSASFHDYQIKTVLVALVFISCKSHHIPLKLADLSRVTKVAFEVIVELELVVLEILHFNVDVVDPYAVNWGIGLQTGRWDTWERVKDDIWGQVSGEAMLELDWSRIVVVLWWIQAMEGGWEMELVEGREEWMRLGKEWRDRIEIAKEIKEVGKEEATELDKILQEQRNKQTF